MAREKPTRPAQATATRGAGRILTVETEKEQNSSSERRRKQQTGEGGGQNWVLGKMSDKYQAKASRRGE